MIKIKIPDTELYIEETNRFYNVSCQELNLEHSLVSISKWESKWKKPFFSLNKKTKEESIDYVRCMTLTQNVDPMAYYAIPNDEMNRIKKYVDDPMTATTFSEKSKPSREIITSELIYYWMIALNVPFECQKWHINRLLTLIRVCAIKNSPQKKMTAQEIRAMNKKLNSERRARLNTTG